MKTQQTAILRLENCGEPMGKTLARAGAPKWARIRKGFCEWAAVFGVVATMSTLTAATIVLIVSTLAGAM